MRVEAAALQLDRRGDAGLRGDQPDLRVGEAVELGRQELSDTLQQRARVGRPQKLLRDRLRPRQHVGARLQRIHPVGARR